MKPIPALPIEAFRRERHHYDALKALADGVNATRAALEDGTYAAQPQYLRWGTVFCPSSGMWPGATAPTLQPFFGAQTLQFQVNASLHSSMVVPADFASGGLLVPTLLISFTAAPVAGEIFNWTLSHSVANVERTFLPLPSPSFALAFTAQPSDNGRLRRLRFQAVTATIEPLSLVTFAVARAAGATSIDAFVIGVEWAYQKGPFGLETQP